MNGFTAFRGTLKRLSLDPEDEPARAAAFQWAFPGFLDPVVEQAGLSANTDTPRMRRRRYSGGLFSASKPLSRGRYSTVCIDRNGDDVWGLCQELRAYAGSTLRQKIFCYDLGDTPVQQMFREKGWLVGNRLGLHFVDPDGQIFARYASIGDAALINPNDPGFWRTHLDYFIEHVEIENVVDLRLPGTQQWFCETFREGFGDFWTKPAGRSVGRFQDMLPSLMSPELGGSQVTDAIGYALRTMGASGLIYPAARCDLETVVEDGALRGWRGFNFVDFRGAATEAGDAPRFDDPDPWDIPVQWPDLRCEIAELSEDQELAERLKGSWRLLGIRENHERFWEAGGLLGGRDVGEWEQQDVNIRGKFVQELNRTLGRMGPDDRTH